MQPTPQALQTVEPMPGQPRLEFTVRFNFFLQRLERLQSGRQFSTSGRLGVDRLLQGAALVIEQRHAQRQLFQTCLGLKLCFLCGAELGRQAVQPRLIGRIQGIAVRCQLVTTLPKTAQLVLHIALVCGQYLDLLLHLGDRAALLVGFGLCPAQGIFQCGQLALLLLALRGQQLSVFFVLVGLGLQAVKLARGVVPARGPLGGLFFELLQPLLYTHPALDHEADFSFQTAHLRAGLVQFALSLIDLVTRSVMRLANGLQISF